MSCDFQRVTYRPLRPQTATNRTTYGSMNWWLNFTPDIADNPYTRANNGHFRSMTPVIDMKQTSKKRDNVQTSKSLPGAYKPPDPNDDDTSRHYPPSCERLARAQKERLSSQKSNGPTTSVYMGYHVKPVHAERPQHSINTSLPVHLQYGKTNGYDDFHKAFKKIAKVGISPTYPVFGPPRLRAGRGGASWRHVKEVMQAAGKRTLFVDGIVRVDDHGRTERVPAGELIQSDGERICYPRVASSPGKKMTAHELLGLKGAEYGHWNIVR